MAIDLTLLFARQDQIPPVDKNRYLGNLGKDKGRSERSTVDSSRKHAEQTELPSSATGALVSIAPTSSA